MKSKKWDIPVPEEIKNKIYTIDHVLKNTPYPELVEAVLEQMGFSDSEDYYQFEMLGRTGADAGVNGFIYYGEVERFCKDNQSIISYYVLEWCRDTGSINIDDASDALMELDVYTSYDDLDEDERQDALDNMNSEVLAMCYGFKKWSPYWKNHDFDPEDLWDLYRFLNDDEYVTREKEISNSVTTFLAWFCLEGVAYEFQKQD
jgi:hypothetical protein